MAPAGHHHQHGGGGGSAAASTGGGSGTGDNEESHHAQSRATATVSSRSTGRGAGTGGERSSSRRRQRPKSKDDDNKITLVQRLIKACNQHKHSLHEFHSTSEDTKKSFSHFRRPMAFEWDDVVEDVEESMEDKCRKQLTSLWKVFQSIEKDYEKFVSNVERLDTTVDSDGGSGGGGNRLLRSGANEGDMLEAARRARDLCILYRSTLQGCFCPYSLRMLDWGRGGVIVLPRVHILMRSLPSTPIIVQALRTVSEEAAAASSNGARKAGNGDPAAAAASAPSNNYGDEPFALDDIASTIAMLLNCIPERRLRASIVRDLASLLYDLTVVDSSCSLPLIEEVDDSANPNEQTSGVRLSLFHEMIEAREQVVKDDGGSGERGRPSAKDDDTRYEIDIKSRVSLLSFQRGGLRVLATLLSIQRQDRNYMLGLEKDTVVSDKTECDCEFVLQSNGNQYLESAGCDDRDLKVALFAALRQILLSPSYRIRRRGAAQTSPEACVLAMLTKIEAMQLLALLWGDLASLEESLGSMDLATLCCQTILAHLRAIVPSSSGATSSSSAVHFISSRYFTALHSTFVDFVVSSELLCPDGGKTLLPKNETNAARSNILCTLLHCVKYFPGMMQSSNHAPSEDEKKLCRLVLRVVHILLNTPRSLQHRSLAHNHCAAHEIYPSLLGMAKDPVLSPIAIAITGNLLGEIKGGGGRNAILADACVISWQRSKEAARSEKEDNSGHASSSAMAQTRTTGGSKRRKVSQSKHTKTGGQRGSTNAALPKQQLQIELSPQRKRTHSDMTSPVPSNALLSNLEYKADDASPTSSIARILDEALNEAYVVLQDAAAARRSAAGTDGGEASNVDSAVLSTVTARSISVIGGALNLVIRLGQRNDSVLCSSVDQIITTLARALTLLGSAVRYGSMASSEARTIGPNRLRRALNILVGVGLQLHSFLAASTSAHHAAGAIDNSDSGAGNGHGAKEDVISAANTALRTISICAVDVWTRNSSLLEQLRARERDGGHSTAASFSLDSLSTSLEGQHAIRTGSNAMAGSQGKRNRVCGGMCAALCDAVGIATPDSLSSRCFCALLGRERKVEIEQDPFTDDLAGLILELELPLPSRCMLLGSICPSDDTSLASFQCILASPLEEQSCIVTASALACLPICFSTAAQRSGTGSMDLKSLVQLITKLGLHKSVTALAFASSKEIPDVPYSLRRAAVVCLRRSLELYTSTSTASFGNHFDISTRSAVYSCLMNLASTFCVSGICLPDKGSGKQSITSTISPAAFDLLAAPIISSKEDFATMPAQVRLVKWKYMAFTSHHCSPLQLRKSGGHQSLFASIPAAVPGNDKRPAEDADVEEAGSKSIPSLLWLFRTPFVDPDSCVRDYTAANIGPVLVGNDCKVLFALLLNDSEWRVWTPDPEGSSTTFAALVVERCFQEIDTLLYKYCYVNQGQLSFTARGITNTMESPGTAADSSAATRASKKATLALSYQMSAVRALSSICQHADLDTFLGRKLFEHSLLHLVRLWVSPNSSRLDIPRAVDMRVPGSSILSSAAWEELCTLDSERPFRSILMDDETIYSFTPMLFSEILVSNDSSGKRRARETSEMERYIICLMRFIRAFLITDIIEPKESQAFAHTRQRYIPRKQSVHSDLLKFAELHFPAIASELIKDRDIDALKMIVLFRLYICEEGKKIRKEEVEEQVHGGTRRHSDTIKEITKNLNFSDEITLLYSSPPFVRKALPRMLLYPGSESLFFYFKTILGGSLGLKQVFAEVYIVAALKEIAWELGKYDVLASDVNRRQDSASCDEGYTTCLALKKLGLIQNLQDLSDKDTNTLDVVKHLGAIHTDASMSLGTDAAKKMVSKRMMQIIVSVVMHEWSTRSLKDRIRAVKCLKAILLFLHDEESPRYLTQIMSIINKAISTSSSHLHLIAVSVLSDYVQMVLKQNLKLIGANLSDIVVTLFPLFESAGRRKSKHSHQMSVREEEADPYRDQVMREALSLLNCLVTGKIGKKLAQYFREIPFLPSNPALAGVRSALKGLGVDIDDLLVMTQVATQRASSQDACTGRDSIGSLGSEGERARSKDSSDAQAALRKRLGILSKLLTHENKEVRIAVLRHLTDLLRANRGLFLRLVESEESVSLRFLTVVKDSTAYPGNEDGSGGAPGSSDLSSGVIGKGGVTEIVQKLVSRCVIETDGEARIELATCLGEMGAIDPNRLGREVNATSAALLTKDSFDVYGYHGSWRLSQPPWKSQIIRYELHLVTHQLVTALKGTKDVMGQHKIAFTIQELLSLLDESAAKLYASSQSHQAKPSGAGSSSSNQGETKKEMGAWLCGKLDEAGVRDVLEPYWRTLYKQVDISAPRSPPFLVNADTYFQWLRDWCRFLIWRSQESQRSRWKDFFHACRSAIRQETSVCEFLLPLLVLDSLCFGDVSDEKSILSEMIDALTFTTAKAAATSASQMPLPERQKVANAIFVVLDTLSLWAERETEDRHRSNRGGSSSSSSMSYLAGADTEWPADESLVKIEDMLKAIPLSTCAAAAEAVGMHARSLRYLETEARLQTAKSVYDDIQSESYLDHDGEGEFNGMGRRTLLGKTILQGTDTRLMRKVFGDLEDSDTMTSISQDSAQLSRNIIDNIKEREIRGDWSGSLRMYEQALQLRQAKNQRQDEAITGNADDAVSLKSGMLKCLLELGQLESALNQTKGIIASQESSRPRSLTSNKRDRLSSSYEVLDEDASKVLAPSAAEAAWRLGQWDTLDGIIGSWDDASSAPDPESQYGISFGRAMLGLHKGQDESVAVSLEAARTAVLQSLSGAARESYSRAYPYLLRLQCIREVENASELMRTRTASSYDEENLSMAFADLARSESALGWEWDGRLRIADSGALGSSAIMNTRLALTRIFDDPVLEGALWLKEGKRARKSGLFHIAENSLAHADAVFDGLAEIHTHLDQSLMISLHKNTNDVKLQCAKLEVATGKSTAALRHLAQEQIDIKGLLLKDDAGLKASANTIIQQQQPTPNDHQDNVAGLFEENVKIFGRSLLTGTEWICDSGLKSASEIMDRYNLVSSRLRPDWERGHFCFAKYLDSLLESRIKALSGQVGKGKEKDHSTSKDDDEHWAKMMRRDNGCQKYLIQAMEEYGKALQLGQKHVFQALPRLLSLWFDFTSIDPRPPNPSDNAGKKSSSTPAAILDERVAKQLEKMQRAANAQMSRMVRAIPAIAYYTALPQLISRVGHRDSQTSEIVIIILKRLLTKFPQQAMWSLGWLRNSANNVRARAGEEIFRGAQRNFREREDMKKHDLLDASKTLFAWLITIAKFNPKGDHKRSFKANGFKHRGVELCEFVPPVQAALSVIPSTIGHGRSNSRENFPAFVPRMRAFATSIGIMQSKARPKKLTAFAIPAGQSPQLRRSSSTASSSGRSQPGDAGEMHFLVKQEAKGDLRKDARVQDLNNVINRLLSGHGANSSTSGTRQRRRLRLRTFSVICLSEDCGILEWVPNTDSLRNLVMSSYNPQAAPHSIRRRGGRIGNFTDAGLRNNYMKSQDMYFKSGNLTRAGEMLEELILKPFPPVLYWWFMQKFLDPHAWFEARMAFTLSAATWSAVGHVIGLGDRHSENILVDTSSGDCVHVDFDCIFDKALLLPRPEVVPFRLTPNMLDAFGPTGADGAFTGGLISAMSTLRDNSDILLSVLEPFLKDPIIDWRKHRSQQKQGVAGNAGTSASEVAKAKHHIKIIEGRLNGVYNLENPNKDKYRRVDLHTADQDDDMAHLLPLSVEGQVQKMITEATSNENLVQTYIGWMPWL